MYLGDHANSRPDDVAVTMWPSRDSLTFGALYDRSSVLASVFQDCGLRPGERVAILAYNDLEWFVVAFAALNSGLYLAPVNAHLTADEAAFIVNDSGARALVVSSSTASVASQLIDRTDQVEVRLSLDSTFGPYRALEEVCEGVGALTPADEQRGTFMFYSSGTTGRPKGIKPPLPESPAAHGDPMLGAIGRMWHAEAGSVFLSTAPLHHAAPLRTSTMMLEAGASVVCLEQFDAEQALTAIEECRVTVSQWVPTMFIRMLKLSDEAKRHWDLSSHRRAVHAAAPCPVWVKEAMIDWWGPIVAEYYAGSENIGTTFIESDEWLRHRGSVGRVAQGTIHICDESGQELPVGEDGLVYFDTPSASVTYHNDPAKALELRHPFQEWRTLGDIGHLDGDGYLYLSDRATFMIISGGANVYPQEIENVLSQHPAVADAAVIGIPDADLGERPLAVLQLVDSDADGGVIVKELEDLCREQLARYKMPSRFEITDHLPRGEDGKLRKKDLRAQFRDQSA